MTAVAHLVVWQRHLTSDVLPVRTVDAGSVAVSDPAGTLDVTRVPRIGTESDANGLYLAGPETALAAWEMVDGVRRDIPVSYVPEGAELFERNKGVFESDALRDAHVAIVGVGSGGSAVLRELVHAGVGRFTLMDHDRMAVGNACRHELSLRDVGRLKVNALADYVRDRNPAAVVTTRSWRLTGETLADAFDLIAADPPRVLICGTDNRESRLLVNRLGVQLDLYTLFGGVRQRAFAADVLQVVPGITPCYQCFVSRLPAGGDPTVRAGRLSGPLPAYTDRPVAAEPGLAMDIAPPALLMAKLALTELLRGTGSRRFDGLAEDLVAPAYFWLSRREPDTIYEHWPILGDSAGDGPRIQQWLGRWLERDENCAACGVFLPDVDDHALPAPNHLGSSASSPG